MKKKTFVKKKIFVINGEAGCGKDTFVICCRSAISEPFEVWNVSMVDKIKELAKAAGWNGEKTPENRKFLSDLKDLCDSTFQTSFSSVKEKVDEFNASPFGVFLFIHAREPEDIKRLCNEFGAKSILIKRDGYKTEASNHADANVYNYEYDIQIVNPGTMKEYMAVADQFVTTQMED